MQSIASPFDLSTGRSLSLCGGQ